MKSYLLIGSGNRRAKVSGEPFEVPPTTIDIDMASKPDIIHDLDVMPWPLPGGMFDEIHCIDVLEHLGRQGDYRHWFALFSEIWRVLKTGGTFHCLAPRAGSVWALGDPGHTRIITEEQLVYLCQPAYSQVGITPMTDYRWCYSADFDVENVTYHKDHIEFRLKAIKPARDAADYVERFKEMVRG